MLTAGQTTDNGWPEWTEPLLTTSKDNEIKTHSVIGTSPLNSVLLAESMDLSISGTVTAFTLADHYFFAHSSDSNSYYNLKALTHQKDNYIYGILGINWLIKSQVVSFRRSILCDIYYRRIGGLSFRYVKDILVLQILLRDGTPSKRPKICFQDQLSFNAGQKYCRMLQVEHSAILWTFI